jgi:hypothetical protein
MNSKFLLPSLICAYLILILPFTTYLCNRPVINKVGYIPEAEVLKFTVGDHRYLIAEMAVFKAMLYFGDMYDTKVKNLKLPPEYGNMAKMLSNAALLDPYNVDTYYLAQAAFVWDVKDSARDINKLLIYGMRYRTWDFYLPFFAGFNSAYFLHDYRAAADFMQKAALLSGDPLFANLSARYFHQAGHTELGIMFIDSMEKGAKDDKIRQSFHLRKDALVAAQSVFDAVIKFREVYKSNPASINQLVSLGFLKSLPKDPYGGQFYLTDKGTVESTSKFAFGGQNR